MVGVIRTAISNDRSDWPIGFAGLGNGPKGLGDDRKGLGVKGVTR